MQGRTKLKQVPRHADRPHGACAAAAPPARQHTLRRMEPSLWASAALGALDAVYARMTTCGRSWTLGFESRRRRMFFSDGWGDVRRYQANEQALLEEFAADGGAAFALAPGSVEWTAVERRGEWWTDEGRVRSPVAERVGLPEACATLRFLFVRRNPTSVALPATRALVLQMAATGATEYEPRLGAVAVPLLESGIASIIIMAPWYGSRAPPGQDHCYIHTAEAYLQQTLAIVTEGAALLRWMGDGFCVSEAEEVGSLPIAVTGFSWGAAMASVAAVVSQRPVACVPCCGSASPDVMVTGMMRWQHDWDTLRQTFPQHAANLQLACARDAAAGTTCSYATAQAELLRIFRAVSLEKVIAAAATATTSSTIGAQGNGVGRKSKCRTLGSVVQLQAMHDGYILHAEGGRLHAQLQSVALEGATTQLQWHKGGHVLAFLNQENKVPMAVVEAVDALESGGMANVAGGREVARP